MGSIPTELKHAAVLAAMLAACGEPTKAEAVPAAAFDLPTVDAKKAAEGLAVKKREADAKSQQIAEQAHVEFEARIDTITIVPPDRITSIGAACDALEDAVDAFNQRRFAKDPAGLAGWEAKKADTFHHLRKVCRKNTTIELANCQINALRNAHDDMLQMEVELTDRCRAKFGPPDDGKDD